MKAGFAQPPCISTLSQVDGRLNALDQHFADWCILWFFIIILFGDSMHTPAERQRTVL